MPESQFYARIILIALFGILFTFSMLKKGKKNSVENPPEKHLALKVIAVIFLVLSLLSLAAGIFTITNVQFPSVMMNERPIWGYPTPTQNMALNFITNAFAFLAFAAYFAVFKKSRTKWWQKLLKLLGTILMWLLFDSATDLHEFNIYELLAPIGFIILAIIGLTAGNRPFDEDIVVDAPTSDEEHKIEDNSRFMPNNNIHTKASEITIETIDVEL